MNGHPPPNAMKEHVDDSERGTVNVLWQGHQLIKQLLSSSANDRRI